MAVTALLVFIVLVVTKSNGGSSERKFVSMISADGKNKFHRDNRGAAMAMVIIIIAFVAILAAVLMFTSYAGYRMRMADRQGKDTFYTAETVLDEINVGLQGEISDALTSAYQEVMTNYSLEGSAGEREKAFRETYFNKLREKLQKGSGSGETDHYKIALLRGYLSAESLGNGTDGSRPGFNSYGAIVESDIGVDDDDMNSFKMEVSETSLILKDLRVSYVNRMGYVSIISTDIRIDLPAFNFSQATELPSLEACSLIADDTLFMGNVNTAANITVTGDAYAGQMIIVGEDGAGTIQSAKTPGTTAIPTVPNLLRTVVTFKKSGGAGASDMPLVISRGDIEVGKTSTLNTADAELWAQNMTLTSATVKLDGSTNLSDDLTLDGTDSVATVSGEYNGFGYLASSLGMEENGASSAIVINGRSSKLDLSGLERMVISGRTYVTNTYKGRSDSDPDKANIMMGESVAVKSNQLIYLVPGEALGCKIESDGTIGTSEYNCNPLTQDQYEEIINHPDDYVLLNGDKEISALGGKKLSLYIREEPLAGGGMAYMPEVIFKRTSDPKTTLVYCYLRFPNEDAANRYFKDFYGVNAENVDRYTSLYAKEIRMDKENLLYLNIAGNMLTYEEGDTSRSVVDASGASERTQAQTASALKKAAFAGLCAKMVSNTAQLTAEELGRTAFQNIIDEYEVNQVRYAMGGSATVEITTPAGKMILTNEQNYIVDSTTPDDVKIIISLYDVTVRRDFEGLIIAKRNITIAAGTNVTLKPIDAATFSNILMTEVEPVTPGILDDHYYLMNVFRDDIGVASNGSVTYDGGTSKVSMADLISYERWTKK